MRLHQLLSICATLALGAHTIAETTLDNNLVEQMEAVGEQGTVSALVYLVNQVDINSLSNSIAEAKLGFKDRHQLVVETLQLTALRSQENILATLSKLGVKDGLTNVKPFWISNSIRIEAKPSVIRQLANRIDVGHIYLNYEIELVTPVRMGPVEQTDNRGGVEPGITAIRATEAWAMGYTGEGVLVATLDTGVDGNHEALASRWAGLRPEFLIRTRTTTTFPLTVEATVHTQWVLFAVVRQDLASV